MAWHSLRCGVSRVALVPSLILTVLACTTTDSRVPIATWTVGPAVRDLGVEEGPDELEFAAITSAVLLPDGSLAVANSGTSQVRFFSTTGAFTRAIGRRGEGPGEYTGAPLYLEAPGPDTILAFDAGNWHLTTLDSVGSLRSAVDLSQTDSLPFPSFPRVYPRAYLRLDEGTDVRPCVDHTLPTLATTSGAPTASLFQVDQLGYLWQTGLPANPQAPTSWRIHALNGALLATATLPVGFTPYRIARDRILGRLEDSSGVEHVVLLPLERGEAKQQTCPSPAPTPGTPDSAAVRALRATSVIVIQAQETYYADHATYASTADALTLSGVSRLTLLFLTADKRHWFGLLIDPETATTCATGVGYQPPGWREAVPRCSAAAS